ADILPKAEFGLARIALVWYQISGDPSQLDVAEENFRAVIAEAEAGDTRVAELAAQSHGHLGSIALLQSDLATAQSEYQIAAETTQTPRAKAAFWAQLGYVYNQLGEVDLALDAYRQAVAITPDEDVRQKYQITLNGLQTP
ncbi:MAG: tetratricopeptide repeat protein, partial [Chloroflexi bacterium]